METESVKREELTLFYDTYALYAIATGEPSYAPFVKGWRILTTVMNLYELYFSLLKDGKNQLAELFFHKLLENCIPFAPEDIKEAAHVRLRHTKENLSYVDALGYVLALKRRIQFLTGDRGFRELPHVLFVK